MSEQSNGSGGTRRLYERNISMSTGLVLWLAALTGGGGLGSFATGNSIAADLRVMSAKLDSALKNMEDHEGRIRALERGGAR